MKMERSRKDVYGMVLLRSSSLLNPVVCPEYCEIFLKIVFLKVLMYEETCSRVVVKSTDFGFLVFGVGFHIFQSLN